MRGGYALYKSHVPANPVSWRADVKGQMVVKMRRGGGGEEQRWISNLKARTHFGRWFCKNPRPRTLAATKRSQFHTYILRVGRLWLYTVTQRRHEKQAPTKKSDSSSEQRWLLGGVPRSGDCRCHRESFHVSQRCQSATRAAFTRARAQAETQFKQGYIKQVSHFR